MRFLLYFVFNSLLYKWLRKQEKQTQTFIQSSFPIPNPKPPYTLPICVKRNRIRGSVTMHVFGQNPLYLVEYRAVALHNSKNLSVLDIGI